MDARRLALWLALVVVFIVIQYAARAANGKPAGNLLYTWSFTAGTLVQEAIFLLLVLAIAGSRRELLALRRPRGLGRVLGLMAVAVVGIYLIEVVYAALAHPGNEQGLTPSHWEPRHAVAYVVNGALICTCIPLVEELTFRGLGYSLLEPFGRLPAILLVGILFGLSHGLLVELPVIVTFGCALAWIRASTDSVFPGMAVHGFFNLIALVAAVTL